MSIHIQLNGRVDQPVLQRPLPYNLAPQTTGHTYPLAFLFRIPDGNGNTLQLVITADQERVTPKLLKRVASYAATLMESLYGVPDGLTTLPVLLQPALLGLLERHVRLGGPYRDFQFLPKPPSGFGGYGYQARDCGGGFEHDPIHYHLTKDFHLNSPE